MFKKLFKLFTKNSFERELRDDEKIILQAVREKFPEHPNDRLFFVKEDDPLLPVTHSAMIDIFGNGEDGRWIHLSNLAGFMNDGMTIDEIKKTFL